ncbi:FecR family protein [Chitinophaga silvatica]|uniref:FecR family protein n=1 Tax=Chitinophaga silvatica TaxID=2282649 RepID=A0A3E1Y6Y8_9BACT|nr:FecR family protein [Chitinophaga silvatica]RFS20658.1 FecR family protein [Chitinophaga silvatica]
MPSRAEILFHKILTNTATPAEREELYNIMQMPPGEEQLKHQITALLESPKEMQDLSDIEMESMLQAIYAVEKEPLAEKRIPTIFRLGWWAAAAMLLGMLTFLPFRKNSQPTPVAKIENLQPGGNKAVLTLANGQQVILDSAGNQQIAQQHTTLVQQQGQLIYQSQSRESLSGYNTLTTPRGGQFKVILPDGTTVWLNAVSSLHYPLSFGMNRTVELSGEAYFEVASNPNKPFKVKTATGQTIEVLGTTFNVNAYTDEVSTQTTLVSGAVAITDGNKRLELKPGQAAKTIKDREGIELVTNAEIAQATAWKNGLFDFNKMPIKAVMQQLSRWYNIEVSYDDKIPDIIFWGRMDRNLPLQDVLLILEKSDVHFRIENNGSKLIVIP